MTSAQPADLCAHTAGRTRTARETPFHWKLSRLVWFRKPGTAPLCRHSSLRLQIKHSRCSLQRGCAELLQEHKWSQEQQCTLEPKGKALTQHSVPLSLSAISWEGPVCCRWPPLIKVKGLNEQNPTTELEPGSWKMPVCRPTTQIGALFDYTDLKGRT